MKKLIVAIVFAIAFLPSIACTSFCINKNGHLVFGRNYDWVTGEGIVYSNQRNLAKSSFPSLHGKLIEWVSKYGSITFNQYGKEFPTGGMNEKGLVVELMWLDDTRYPKKDERPVIGVLQWIQYQLDNSATVDEVIKSDGQLRIVTDGTPLHYLIADSTGNAASIEFLNGKMVVHTGTSLPFSVLTNSTYASSAQAAKQNSSKPDPSLGLDNSLERFVKACGMIQKINDTPVNIAVTDYAFSILDKVSQGDYTKWSIVYDISNKRILFKTNNFPTIKSVDFRGFDFTCKTGSRMFNMNQPVTGDITKAFTSRDDKMIRSVLERAVQATRQRIEITKEEVEATIKFPTGIGCK